MHLRSFEYRLPNLEVKLFVQPHKYWMMYNWLVNLLVNWPYNGQNNNQKKQLTTTNNKKA